MVKNTRPILEVNDITVSYGSILALHSVSIVVREGEVVALIGSNGAGKSTLLAAVLGVQRPSSGTIKFMGKDITHNSTDSIVASGIAITPEDRANLLLMSVMENLLLGTLYIKGDRTKYLKRTFEKFPMLEGRKKQIAGTLSGGEQQILDIARVLISEPKLIIMDEPTLGLSPIMVDTVFDIIENLKNEGHTILLSEQNARKALEAADRGYVLETGKVSLEGDAGQLRDDPWVHSAYLGIAEVD